MDNNHFLFQQLLAFSAAQTCELRQDASQNMERKIPNGHAVLPAQRSSVVAWIAERRARGESFSCIAASLNAQGLRGANGARWYSASVRQYLHRHGIGDNKAFSE
jgi:hypothetical protein